MLLWSLLMCLSSLSTSLSSLTSIFRHRHRLCNLCVRFLSFVSVAIVTVGTAGGLQSRLNFQCQRGRFDVLGFGEVGIVGNVVRVYGSIGFFLVGVAVLTS